MLKKQAYLNDLTDEQVLEEFVKRFQCDAAVLIYLESSSEFGLGRWRNSDGRRWVKDIFAAVKSGVSLNSLGKRVVDDVTASTHS
ncbi:hypothetical protein F0L74_21575 [Chitinophaga agrisoli]|uniref:Uncharacterized protein n=1 Tax=Chitinophaga agrisoli TaxID=2607653 RepID=A0A5B2VKM7_9BACT|nr:hypothetical protein [Chitinophaga agrisoli]KAA2238807.1 hypothetical protein F0L74_21575 [Chitinophaga agrisoli]